MDVFQQNSATVNIRSYELKAIQQDQLFVKHCILYKKKQCTNGPHCRLRRLLHITDVTMKKNAC